MHPLETQLWLWLDECESLRPRAGKVVLGGADKVVGLDPEGQVGYVPREGSEAREAGARPS